eukprot:scaffold20419_cov69-Phaeocystis_antarctica.AAC.1
MGPAATDEATYVHDRLITEAWHAIIGTASARPDERNRAERQAQLPVAMGGCGLTPMRRPLPAAPGIADAACVGSWALIWRPMQQLCPQLFKDVDLATVAAAGLRGAADGAREADDGPQPHHRGLQDLGPQLLRHRGRGMHALPPDQPLRGEGLAALVQVWHGRRITTTCSASLFVRDSPHRLAQAPPLRAGRGEARGHPRFVAASQPYAGTFLNAVPKYKPFRMPTWALRLCLQRRLGLPLLVAAAAAGGGRRSRSGHMFDALGDVA